MGEVTGTHLTEKATQLNHIESAVLKTLLYFDIFSYPLKLEEIQGFCQEVKSSKKEITESLQKLVVDKLVQKSEDFYSISSDTSLIEERKKGNAKAIEYFKKAEFVSKVIATFPFVEGIFISGSLSKGTVDKKGDIDYFIITKPNRLWLCRTLLVVFKKIFLLNSKKYFCVNYFVDYDNLEIPDRNIFTATEIVFVKPIYNSGICDTFIDANEWSYDYYPNKTRTKSAEIYSKRNFAKRTLEFIFAGIIGERLDAWCFKFTLKHWKKKFSNFDETSFDLNLRSKKNVSKHHPNAYQEKVLNQFQTKIKEFEMRHFLKLNN